VRLDHLRHGEGLARAGDAEQHLGGADGVVRINRYRRLRLALDGDAVRAGLGPDLARLLLARLLRRLLFQFAHPVGDVAGIGHAFKLGLCSFREAGGFFRGVGHGQNMERVPRK
jgi:hypothetical protein